MTQQENLILRGLELKLDRLLDFASLQQFSKKTEEKMKNVESEWITLTQACKMHGGYTLNTLRARPDLQPKNGKGVMIGKNKCWRKEDVEEWLNAVSPAERKAYVLKYSEVRR